MEYFPHKCQIGKIKMFHSHLINPPPHPFTKNPQSYSLTPLKPPKKLNKNAQILMKQMNFNVSIKNLKKWRKYKICLPPMKEKCG